MRPLLAKSAVDESHAARANALRCVLSASPGPPLRDAALSTADLILHIMPPETDQGVALPLKRSTTACRSVLQGARLGFVRLAKDGSMTFGEWSAIVGSDGEEVGGSEAAAREAASFSHQHASLESLLRALQPPRAPPPEHEQPWVSSWRRWSEFKLPTDVVLAMVRSLERQLKVLRLGSSGDGSGGGGDGARELIGEDVRGGSGVGGGGELGAAGEAGSSMAVSAGAEHRAVCSAGDARSGGQPPLRGGRPVGAA